MTMPAILLLNNEEVSMLLDALQTERKNNKSHWPKEKIDLVDYRLRAISFADAPVQDPSYHMGTIVKFFSSAPYISIQHAKSCPHNAGREWFGPEFKDFLKALDGADAWATFFGMWRQRYAYIKASIDHLKHSIGDMKLSQEERSKVQSRRQRAAEAAKNMMHILFIAKQEYRWQRQNGSNFRRHRSMVR